MLMELPPHLCCHAALTGHNSRALGLSSFEVEVERLFLTSFTTTVFGSIEATVVLESFILYALRNFWVYFSFPVRLYIESVRQTITVLVGQGEWGWEWGQAGQAKIRSFLKGRDISEYALTPLNSFNTFLK